MFDLLGKIRKILNDEKGLAIFAAVGIAAILLILAIGIFVVTQNDLMLSESTKGKTVALHVAEAGIDKILWQLKATGSTETTTTVSVPQGIAVVTANQDESSPFYWTITSVGTTTRNATGYSRTVQVVIYNFSFWDMNFAGGSNQSLTAGGGGLNGTTSITGPFYCRGNLEVSGTSELSNGPLFIKDGSLNKQSSGSHVGKSDYYIDVYASYGKKGNEQNVYIDTLSQNVPVINLPDLLVSDMEDKMNSAIIQSKDNKIGYSDTSYSFTEWLPISHSNAHANYYKLIDNDTSLTLLEWPVLDIMLVIQMTSLGIEITIYLRLMELFLSMVT